MNFNFIRNIFNVVFDAILPRRERRVRTESRTLEDIPLLKTIARERGWNQIDLVLKALPHEFRDGTLSTHTPHALVRTRATRAQTRLPRSERLSNVAGAFSLTDGALVRDSHIFLVDDVTTTGATLANAANPLRRAGAKVTLLPRSARSQTHTPCHM